ncbi:8026_t:CDS:2 [Gigaspora margarita]|uniref:8026_t:CDS:1 n=1 Tax=Gigaspora margarita TaxID=4874 RepID=A0ABN7V3C6_GIGMA|nr:8026_t:CDS:2 [Gigaspora margarita]
MNNNNSSESDQKKKICTTCDPNLSKVYPWLEKSEDNDGVVTVFCTWCRAAKRVNQFTEGTNSLRKQTFERHLATVDHQKATIFQDNQQTTIIQGFTRQLNDQILKIISLMRNSIDNETFNQRQHEYASYENPISGRAFLASIAFVIEHEIIQDTSFTAKHLAIVTKYIAQNTPVLQYLGMIELENCNSESINNNLERFIIAKSLNIENLTHFGSDGASTMLGQRTGVAARLKKYNPYLTENHCIAHRLHLASQDAAEQVAYFKTYDTLVKGIYLYFSSSYKRLLTLKMVQHNLEEPELVLLNIISTRWLSFSNIIHNFHQCLESIKGALLEEAANNQQAASLLANINQNLKLQQCF